MFNTERRPRVRFAMILVLALIAGILILPTLDARPAQAVTARDFNAGSIISDGEFYNGSSLSAEEVQTLLNSKVENCRIGKPPYMPGSLSPSGSGNMIASNCLKDFRMTTPSRAGDAYCSSYTGQPNETAAQIIAKVGRACGISQKVLLVMLEKEQSLVTDDWPVTRNYNYAMGMNCPDSGPNGSANCNSDSAGFFLQVMLGARQLKVYRAHPTSFNHQPFQVNTIRWNPNAGCGTSQVYIQNWATAALYNYTPYRPNSAALDAGWGVGDGCSSYGNRNFFLFYNSWFVGSPPIGYVDGFAVNNGIFSLAGWALDPDTLDSISVHVYVGRTLATVLRADQSRPDVAAAFPGHTSAKGYSWQTPLDRYSGKQEVCVFAIGHPTGENPQLGCRSVQFTGIPEQGRQPIGNVENISVNAGILSVNGWALDPDTAAPISTHVYVGSTLVRAARADQLRNDVGVAYPDYGANHGFSFQIPTDGFSGSNRVCVYAINSVPGSNPLLACKQVTFDSRTTAERGRSPVGNLDAVSLSGGNLSISGWSLDPDTAEPIQVHVYVGSILVGFKFSDVFRADVGAAYPANGPNHGFELTVPSQAFRGVQKVCVFGINSVPGFNPQIGCRSVDFGGVSERGRVPIGNLDNVTNAGGRLQISGWAIDPDTEAPISVHAYLGSTLVAATTAGAARPDVAALYPEYGAEHGFVIDVASSVSITAQQLCVYGINSIPGHNPLLGCRQVSIG